MAGVRRLLVLVHRYVGLAIAGFLAIAGLTGSVLAFQAEIDRWLNPHLFHVERTTRTMLSPSRLAERAEAYDPKAHVVTVELSSRPEASAILYVEPADPAVPLGYNQLFVDPGSGAVLGRRMLGVARLDREHLIPSINRLHYSLFMPGVWSYWLMGGVALVWMVDCVIGFCLTFPLGRPFWRKWRTSWKIKTHAGHYRLNLDLHRASGLWLWPMLFLMALTGVSLNLSNEVFRPVLAALLPTTPSIWDGPAQPARPMKLDFDAALAKAREEADRRGWWNASPRLIYGIHDRTAFGVGFSDDRGYGLGSSTIIVSGSDGHIVSVEHEASARFGDLVAYAMYPIHSGQIAGLPGRILICIIGLVVAMLSITGIYIWSKKRIARNGARHRAANQPRTSPRMIESIHAAE